MRLATILLLRSSVSVNKKMHKVRKKENFFLFQKKFIKSLKFRDFLFMPMSSFYFNPKHSLSHLLILISVGISLIGFAVPQVINMYGFHSLFALQGDYLSFFVQLILFQFLHGNMLHLFLNSYFLYVAGPEIESRMTKDRFIAFFIGSTLFTATSLHIFASDALTIGISGFCMALLSYLWIDLRTTHHPMATQIGVMLFINILLWLSGDISFVGHAAGAIWGIIWWQMRKKW